MAEVLFVNACVRGEASRTKKLCSVFLDEYIKQNPQDTVEELDLTSVQILPLYGRDIIKRDADVLAGKQNSEKYALAQQFAAADKIVVGAPYWDLSFPSVLKVYVEHISVTGITFGYEGDWLRGLCRAEKLAYITTAGGPLPENKNHGYLFFKDLCEQLGIPECAGFYAEGLDMADEGEIKEIINEAYEKAKIFAKSF